jgi:large subunit ribosomal protein L17
MKHHKANRTFGREKNQRHALMRSLAVSFFDHGRILTTEAKAKELRPYVEKLITKGKENTLASRRLLVSRLGSPDAAKKVAAEIAPRYESRQGGYTRIIKLDRRPGDAAAQAVIELL